MIDLILDSYIMRKLQFLGLFLIQYQLIGSFYAYFFLHLYVFQNFLIKALSQPTWPPLSPGYSNINLSLSIDCNWRSFQSMKAKSIKLLKSVHNDTCHNLSKRYMFDLKVLWPDLCSDKYCNHELLKGIKCMWRKNYYKRGNQKLK